MKQFNFFTLCLTFLFFAIGVNAQITVSPWQIHEGKEGVVDFKTKFHGDPAAYDKASIPAANDSGWSEAPTDAKGNVSIDRRSSLKCNQQLDFTYFQASVNIPENSTVDKFTVSYNKADDGARIYIFNSANSKGAFDAAADLQYNKKNTGNVDLKQHVKKGEVNRVVIVQFDDCGVGNTLNGINIEVNGEVIEVAKDPGQALHFNGTNDYVQLGEVLPKGANYTKEVWVKFESLKQYPNILSSGPSAFWIEGTLTAMNNGFGKKLKSSNKIELNKWMHVAVTWDGKTMILYENGKEVARSTDQPAYGGGEIQVGKWPSANTTYFNGEMDEVRIWDYARSAEQISGNKDCELSGKEKGLVAYYQFNQGIAGGDNKNIDKLESTPVGKSGTLKNFTRTGMSSNFVLTGITRKDCPTADEGFDPNKCYRLTCQWQGEGKSLDVVNDAKDDKLQLANTGKYTGQYWKITPVGDGYYRLTTVFQGEGKSLDIINDAKDNRLQLAKTGNYTGQYWKITPLGNGYHRLTTKFTGEDKSLDVINDGKNNQLQMAKTGKYTGQYWKLTEMDCLPAPTGGAPAPVMEVAKGKTARQSSTKYDANGAAANAVDGNKKGAWSWKNNTLTHTQDENSPWWEVDLGEVYDISKIEIWNRTDCCWDRLKNFYIMVSETPITANSTSQDQFIGGAHSFTSGDHPSMILEGKKRGRYVRIFKQSDSKSPLTLAEVEIYGSKGGRAAAGTSSKN